MLASPFTKNRISLKGCPSSTSTSFSLNLTSLEREETTLIMNLSYFWMGKRVPRNKSGSRRNCLDTWLISRGCRSRWRSFWGFLLENSLCSPRWLLLEGRHRSTKPSRRNLRGNSIYFFISSYLFGSNSRRNRLLPRRYKNTLLFTPSETRSRGPDGTPSQGAWPSSERTVTWCRRTPWWIWLSEWWEKYLQDVGEQLAFVVIHELWALLDNHLKVGCHELKLFSEEVLLGFLKHGRKFIKIRN